MTPAAAIRAAQRTAIAGAVLILFAVTLLIGELAAEAIDDDTVRLERTVAPVIVEDAP